MTETGTEAPSAGADQAEGWTGGGGGGEGTIASSSVLTTACAYHTTACIPLLLSLSCPVNYPLLLEQPSPRPSPDPPTLGPKPSSSLCATPSSRRTSTTPTRSTHTGQNAGRLCPTRRARCGLLQTTRTCFIPTTPASSTCGSLSLARFPAYRHSQADADDELAQCDGVIWTGPAGDELCVHRSLSLSLASAPFAARPQLTPLPLASTPHIVETIDFLRGKGKKLAFITNNATRSRQQYVDKVRSSPPLSRGCVRSGGSN